MFCFPNVPMAENLIGHYVNLMIPFYVIKFKKKNLSKGHW
jgi:hypothetical protein